MGRLFGTDGVRGVANRELTPELALSLGFAGACVLRRAAREGDRPFFVVGRDTRRSGDLLEAAFTAGVLASGVDVRRLGVIPTPGVAYLAKQSGALAGVMVSASHNPMEDNGIKFFGPDGFKLLDASEDEIERQLAMSVECPRPVGRDVGRTVEWADGVGRYEDFLAGTVRHSFSGMRVAVDAANGAAYEVAARVLRRLGAQVDLLHAEPDGDNINVNCGSTHPEGLARHVASGRYDAGIALDGDADRLIAVDERGSVVDGDRVMLICARDLLERGELSGNTVVTTVMSNYGFFKAAREIGVEVARTSVGDRYVMEAMREGGYALGGEQSGHVIFLRHNTTGDGVLTALQLLDAMAGSERPLSELAAVMRPYPQVLVNVRVADKSAWRGNGRIASAIAQVERELGGDGRVLVRESGTEPIVRVMVEGPEEHRVREWVERIAGAVREQLGEMGSPLP